MADRIIPSSARACSDPAHPVNEASAARHANAFNAIFMTTLLAQHELLKRYGGTSGREITRRVIPVRKGG